MLRLSHRCAFALLILFTPALALAAVPETAATPPGKSIKATWAHIVVDGNYPERAQSPTLFGELNETLLTGIGRLDKAGNDSTISGIILKLKSPEIGRGKLEEFREAIKRLRAKGKAVYAWVDDASAGSYMVAASCDRIIMPESGSLMLMGVRAEVSFFKNLLDLLNVKAEMLRVGKFKSAAEPFTRTEMSPEFREEMEGILDGYYQQMISTIAEGRHLDRDKVIAAIDSGPHTAKAAKELGLVDQIAYEDQVEELIKQAESSKHAQSEVTVSIKRQYGKPKIDTDFSGLTGMAKMINLMMGVEPRRANSGKPKIAVINATGMIIKGRSSSDLFDSDILGSDTFIKAVEQANRDPKVRAIVLRVDSPGGSALASDLMWNALQKVEKPIVVSMGDVAASGGYYISMGADYIFAEPGTLTGSIGVVGGKLALKGLFEKVGITTSVITRGKNSGAFSALDEFTDSERAAMTKMLHDIYEQFTTKAAKGRKMELNKLLELAGGRVYTGPMALKAGLVDKIGTLDDAIAHAKGLAGLKPDDEIDRWVLPTPTSPFEQLFGPLDDDASVKSANRNNLFSALEALSPELTAQLRAATIVNLLARENRLMLLPFKLTVK